MTAQPLPTVGWFPPDSDEWPAYRAALERLHGFLGTGAVVVPVDRPPGRDPVVIAAAACDLRAVRVPPTGLAGDPHAAALFVSADGGVKCVLPGNRSNERELASAKALWRVYPRVRAETGGLGRAAWALTPVVITSVLAGVVSVATTVAAGLLAAQRSWLQVLVIGGGLVIVAVLLGIRDNRAAVLQDRAQAVLEPALWDRVVDPGAGVTRRWSTDDLVAAATSVAQLRSLTAPALLDAALVVCVAGSAVVLLATMSLWLSVASLVAIALVALAVRWAMGPAESMPGRQGGRSGPLLQAVFTAIDEIHLGAREQAVIDRLAAVRAAYAPTETARRRAEERLAAINAGAGVLMVAALLAAGLWGRLGTKELLVAGCALGQLVLVSARLDNVVRAVLLVGRPMVKRGAELLAEPSAPNGRTVPGHLTGAVQLATVSLWYPGAARAAVDEVSLRVEPGAFVVVTGPSGAGKTSLLRLIAGLETPRTGEVCHDGMPLDSFVLDAVRRRVGFVPQDGGAPRGTVRSAVLGTGGADDDERAWAALRSVGLADYVAGLPMRLSTVVSGGSAGFAASQLALMALARALAAQPSLLLLDEPVSAVDADRERFLALIRGLPMTRIVVTHSRHLAEVADRVLVLDRGRLVDSGQHLFDGTH